MPIVDLGEQLDISLRLIVASVLGAAIGLEREIHAHPAGMRTHLLVSLGSAAFTVLSIFFFEAPAAPNGSLPTDPARIAAQIVSGIGFLGAGAILKYGSSVRGLDGRMESSLLGKNVAHFQVVHPQGHRLGAQVADVQFGGEK